VAEAAVSLRTLRREIMAANGWSLRDLYRTLEIPGTNRLRDAQAARDSAVRAAYGMKENEDTLSFLLRLNLALAEKEADGQPVTSPGLTVSQVAGFISTDCIQPPLDHACRSIRGLEPRTCQRHTVRHESDQDCDR
jgi:hypothetical protein